MTGKRSSRRAPGFGRAFPRKKAPSVSERQAHFMPRHAAVGRVRKPFVLKAERLVPGNELFLAGEHHSETALSSHVPDELPYERAGEPSAPVCGIGIHAKDHLPLSRSVVEGGVFIHLVVQVRRVGTHAVDHGNGPVCLVRHHPEALRVGLQSGAEGGLRRGFGGGEAGRLQGSDGSEVLEGRSSDFHKNSPFGWAFFLSITQSPARGKGLFHRGFCDRISDVKNRT